MFKKILCFGAACMCLMFSGCKFAKDEYGTEHCHFKLIEDRSASEEGLYVHEETGVMYYMNTCGDNVGFTAMIKADGTAYTIEDFEMDKRGK